MTTQQAKIVVGVDGSESSNAALRWAIKQAELTGASVEAVTAWHYPAAYGLAPVPADVVDLESNAKGILTEALAAVATLAPQVVVSPQVVEGHAADALLRAAQGAELLVVGSRGLGGFTSALVGSVSLYCVLHAHCPVLVMHNGHKESAAN